jgi:hypothetical protein
MNSCWLSTNLVIFLTSGIASLYSSRLVLLSSLNDWLLDLLLLDLDLDGRLDRLRVLLLAPAVCSPLGSLLQALLRLRLLSARLGLRL